MSFDVWIIEFIKAIAWPAAFLLVGSAFAEAWKDIHGKD